MFFDVALQTPWRNENPQENERAPDFHGECFLSMDVGTTRKIPIILRHNPVFVGVGHVDIK